MSINKQSSIGIVLAGGRSTRYGTPKALEELDGIPFYKRCVNVLAPLVDHSVVVAHPTIEDNLQVMSGTSIIHDRPPFSEQGPLAGIYSAMSSYPASRYFVLACDMPLMKRAIFDYLIEQLHTDLCLNGNIVPIVENQMQPLAAIYSYSIMPIIKRLLVNDKRRFTDLFQVVEPIYLPITCSKWIPCFGNINTPEDYHEIKK